MSYSTIDKRHGRWEIMIRETACHGKYVKIHFYWSYVMQFVYVVPHFLYKKVL